MSSAIRSKSNKRSPVVVKGTSKGVLRPRDADATRDLLLKTAELVFTSLGYDGARVDDIAKRAAVNKRMIYVYFGDKEGLYREVLRAAFARISQRMKLPTEKSADPRTSLEAWIVDYFGFLAQNPGLVRLVNWEVQADGLRSASTVQEVAQQEIQELTTLLHRGIEQGQFRHDTNAALALMAVHALCFGILSRRRLWQSLWRLDLSQPSTATAVAAYVSKLVLDGIGVGNTEKSLICAKKVAV